jgi:hypothetical protein
MLLRTNVCLTLTGFEYGTTQCQNHSGIGGRQPVKRGGEGRGGSHPFLRERVGGTTFFSRGERKYCHLGHFRSLTIPKCSKIAQKGCLGPILSSF